MAKHSWKSDMARYWKKTWHFIWHDDSLASWLVNIVLAFVIIKYAFYPGVGFLLGTSFPIVAVVSNSMEHHAPFDAWWARNEDFYLEFNITKQEFSQFPFKSGFNKGDIMILVGASPDKVDVGDVIVFKSGKPYPIIHRVIDKQDKGMWVYQTKGDNNVRQIVDLASGLDETRVLDKSVLGKAVVRVPFLGYVKIWFVDIMRFFGIQITG